MEARYQELYDRYYEVPSGREQIAVLEELIRLADSNNDVDIAYGARRHYARLCNHEGFPEKGIVAFSWCLSQFDKDPAMEDWHGLLWEYKVILELIPIFATVSREQIIGMQEDMAKRLAVCGESERTAHYYRSWNLMRMGDYETALHHQDKYVKMARTPTSDCRACERDRQIELMARMHRDEEALKLAEPVMSGRMSCGEVPEFTNGHIVKSLLRLGKSDDATQRQAAGYKKIKGDRKYLGTIGDLLLVVIRNRDFDSGLNQILRHLPWAAETGSGELKFRFFSSVALFFEALAAESPKLRKMRIPKQFNCYRSDEQYDPSVMADWFSVEARQLADQFNARNGNDRYDHLLADNRSLAGLDSFSTARRNFSS